MAMPETKAESARCAARRPRTRVQERRGLSPLSRLGESARVTGATRWEVTSLLCFADSVNLHHFALLCTTLQYFWRNQPRRRSFSPRKPLSVASISSCGFRPRLFPFRIGAWFRFRPLFVSFVSLCSFSGAFHHFPVP